jgi:vitamin B12/bleomycin/antimicrobial peptide transport system ATP-binding/permease protein
VRGFFTTLGTIWGLAVPYFRSEDRWPGRFLLATVIAIELGLVALEVLFNQWNARFFNAIQEHNWDSFVSELLYFCMLAAIFIVLAIYQLYLNQWLEIRWRQWMTTRYLGHWLDRSNHYRMQLLGDAADNPDQRIADDVRLFIERTLYVGLNLLNSVVTFASFVAILWGLSALAPLHVFGVDWSIPGYLVWTALVYAVIGTIITHLIGRPLIGLNFNQQRFEADFRFNLVRTRENSEQIALLRGETAEQARLMDRFSAVVRNWRAIMTRAKRLTFLTAGYNQISRVFPYVVVSPSYFAERISLGVLTQTAGAFNSVQSALSVFISMYQASMNANSPFAEWRAVIERLSGFDKSIAVGEAAAATPPVIRVTSSAKAPALALDALDVRLPTGAPLVGADHLAFASGDRVLVTGPSGSGKSTLFRAIGGIWPFGSGTIAVPEGARVMVLPQRPYLPIGSLDAAIAYPAEPGTFDADAVREVLHAVGLGGLAPRLYEDAHWNRMLSLGEQQRLGLARAILHAPDYLFLDEATASLDEPAEAALYRLLQQRLAKSTVVSIGHRSTLRAFHRRHLTLSRDGERQLLREVALEAAE